MAQIGQIIYNVEDYNNNGGLISTTSGSLGSTVSSTSESYVNERVNIYEDIVSHYKLKSFSKLGIQAPPGTRAILNTNKTILIGQNGIYELDAGIAVTSLRFIQPQNYKYREDLSENARDNGQSMCVDAQNARDTAFDELDAEEGLSYTEYWTKYMNIQDMFTQAYQAGLAELNRGINGIYEIDTEQPLGDLKNIIIDFLY